MEIYNLSNKQVSGFIINETISLGYAVVQLVETLRVRFPMGSSRFFVDLNVPVALFPWNGDSPSNWKDYQEYLQERGEGVK